MSAFVRFSRFYRNPYAKFPERVDPELLHVPEALQIETCLEAWMPLSLCI